MTINSGGGTITKTSSTVTTWTGSISNSSPLQLKMGTQCRVSSVKITYEAEDTRLDAGLAYDPQSVTLELGQTLPQPTFSNPHDLTVVFESNNTSVATVTDEGTISLAGGVGTAVITASSEGTLEYKDGEAKFTITVNRKTSTLVVSDDFSMKAGTEVVIDDDIYVTNSDGDVALTSSDATVVKIEDGKLKALKGGTATISVSVAQSSTYEATSDTFVITVEENASVTPEGEGVGGGYVLVTDASTLAEGDKLIIVGISSESYYAMSEQNKNNRNEKKVTMTDGVISINEDVQVITLEGEKDAWYFNVGNGYLYAASSGSNYLKTEEEIDANNNAKAKITISDGVASIVFQGTNTRNVLQYNSSSGLFACYSSASQSPVYLYRLNESNSFDVEIPDAGWRTLVSAKNVSLPSGVKAYTVTEASDDAVTLTEVANIKANNPYLLNGASGDCTLTLMDTDPVEPTGNLLEISTATTGNGEYVLANKSQGVGFYLWNGGYMGAGRVYLPSAVVTNAREFFGFDFTDITGISQVGNEELKIGNVYNLNGQRVAQPTKGLYIVNGKKVIIK